MEIKETSVAHKLQMDSKLTVDKAITLTKQSKAVKSQQSVVLPPTTDMIV